MTPGGRPSSDAKPPIMGGPPGPMLGGPGLGPIFCMSGDIIPGGAGKRVGGAPGAPWGPDAAV